MIWCTNSELNHNHLSVSLLMYAMLFYIMHGYTQAIRKLKARIHRMIYTFVHIML